MSTIDQQKTTWEHEIDDLKKRNRELYEQQHKLEEELRPHREREYKEKQRSDDEKRNAERDARNIADIQRFEEIVTKHVRDPQLRKSAFEYLCARSMAGPFFFPR
jgi:hypothetical protein